jgi:hypothetical protein
MADCIIKSRLKYSLSRVSCSFAIITLVDPTVWWRRGVAVIKSGRRWKPTVLLGGNGRTSALTKPPPSTSPPCFIDGPIDLLNSGSLPASIEEEAAVASGFGVCWSDQQVLDLTSTHSAAAGDTPRLSTYLRISHWFFLYIPILKKVTGSFISGLFPSIASYFTQPDDEKQPTKPELRLKSVGRDSRDTPAKVEHDTFSNKRVSIAPLADFRTAEQANRRGYADLLRASTNFTRNSVSYPRDHTEIAHNASHSNRIPRQSCICVQALC